MDRRGYYISDEGRQKLVLEQNGKCYICGKPETELKDGLRVDHCHKTGVIRGMLCNRCNLGIGHFEDNIDFLHKAVEYLQKERSHISVAPL